MLALVEQAARLASDSYSAPDAGALQAGSASQAAQTDEQDFWITNLRTPIMAPRLELDRSRVSEAHFDEMNGSVDSGML